MALNESLLPEFDREMALTRECLERLPAGKLEWRPDPQSMSVAQLAGFLGVLPSWTTITLGQDSLDLEPPGGQQTTPLPSSPAQILEAFDVNLAAARGALESASDERLMAPWTLLQAGETILTLPRIAVLRGLVMNQLIHHRGQLTVDLQMCDAPVPALHGPSADEQGWA